MIDKDESARNGAVERAKPPDNARRVSPEKRAVNGKPGPKGRRVPLASPSMGPEQFEQRLEILREALDAEVDEMRVLRGEFAATKARAELAERQLRDPRELARVVAGEVLERGQGVFLRERQEMHATMKRDLARKLGIPAAEIDEWSWDNLLAQVVAPGVVTRLERLLARKSRKKGS